MKNYIPNVHYTTWIYLGLCFYLKWYKESLLLFGIILFHEYSHFLVAKLFCYDIEGIDLYPFGAFLKLTDYGCHKAWQDFGVAMAGGASHLFLLSISGLVKKVLGMHLYQYYIQFNLQILCFNLLPIYPMDGYKIIQSILRTRLDYLTSLKVMLIVSVISYIMTFSFQHLVVYIFLGYQLYFFSQNYYYIYLKYLISTSQKRSHFR